MNFLEFLIIFFIKNDNYVDILWHKGLNRKKKKLNDESVT